MVKCSHDEISDGICVYCNVSITGTEALNTAKREIEKAKEELNNALGAKADEATLDQAMVSLNESIRLANEAILNNKDAADSEIADLKTAIETAKSEAIKTASNALAAAKEELNAAIAKKADATTIEAKIGDLNTSIINLEAASKSYDDEKSAELKADVQKDIDDAKSALKSAIDGLSARLEAAENKIGETENEVKFVKTFMLIISGLVAVLGALVIALAATLRRATKSVLNGKN